MNQPSFCNVCDSEILDTTARRCPSCGVFLNPIKNPVISFESKSNIPKSDLADPLADNPGPDAPDLATDLVTHTERSPETGQSNHLETPPETPEKSQPDPEPEQQENRSADLLQESTEEISEESTKTPSSTKNASEDSSNLATETASNQTTGGTTEHQQGKPSVVASEMELGGRVEKWTEQEQNPGSPFPGSGVTLKGPMQSVALDFAHIRLYRAKAFQASSIVLAVWSLLICWKTAWSFAPGLGGFALAVAGLAYRNSRLGWISIGISTVANVLLYLAYRWFHLP